ncbi:TEL2, telomere maintenance protein 2, variant 2 [Balamuthia mandrillaris]
MWGEAVNVACSIPARVANALMADIVDSGRRDDAATSLLLRQERFFEEQLFPQTLEALLLLHAEQHKQQRQADVRLREGAAMLAQMVAKMVVLGQAKSMMAVLLPFMLQRIERQMQWRLFFWRMISMLPLNTIEPFLFALLEQLRLSTSTSTNLSTNGSYSVQHLFSSHSAGSDGRKCNGEVEDNGEEKNKRIQHGGPSAQCNLSTPLRFLLDLLAIFFVDAAPTSLPTTPATAELLQSITLSSREHIRFVLTHKFVVRRTTQLPVLRLLVELLAAISAIFPVTEHKEVDSQHEQAQTQQPQQDYQSAREVLLRTAREAAAIWKEASFVRHSSLAQHRYISKFLLLSLQHLDKDQLESTFRLTAKVPSLRHQKGKDKIEQEQEEIDGEATRDEGEDWHEAAEESLLTSLIKGVTTHIQCPVLEKRILGMKIGEAFSRVLDPTNPLQFEDEALPNHEPIFGEWEDQQLTEESNNSRMVTEENDSMAPPAETPFSTKHDNLSNAPPKSKKKHKQRTENQLTMDPDALYLPSGNSESDDEEGSEFGEREERGSNMDSDSESDLEAFDLEDEESDLRKVSKPKYLRECLSYLRASSNDSHIVDKIELGLQSLEPLIRSDYLNDVEELALPLMRTLLHLHNEYSLPDFARWRLAAMTALVVKCVHSCVPYLTTQFYSANYSLSQRMDVLLVLSEAARELSGCSNDEPQQQQEQQLKGSAPQRQLQSGYSYKEKEERSLNLLEASKQQQHLMSGDRTSKRTSLSPLLVAGETTDDPLLSRSAKQSVWDIGDDALAYEQFLQTFNLADRDLQKAPSKGEPQQLGPASSQIESSAALKSEPKTRIWSSKLKQRLESRENASLNSTVHKQQTSQTQKDSDKENRFVPVHALFVYPLLRQYDAQTNTFSMLGEDSMVLSKLIHVVGLFMECLGPFSLPPLQLYALLKAAMDFVWALRYHTEASVRRALLWTLSRVLSLILDNAVLSPGGRSSSSVGGGASGSSLLLQDVNRLLDVSDPSLPISLFDMGLGQQQSSGSRGGHLVEQFFEELAEIRTYALDVAQNDADELCRGLAALCLQTLKKMAQLYAS